MGIPKPNQIPTEKPPKIDSKATSKELQQLDSCAARVGWETVVDRVWEDRLEGKGLARQGRDLEYIMKMTNEEGIDSGLPMVAAW